MLRSKLLLFNVCPYNEFCFILFQWHFQNRTRLVSPLHAYIPRIEEVNYFSNSRMRFQKNYLQNIHIFQKDLLDVQITLSLQFLYPQSETQCKYLQQLLLKEMQRHFQDDPRLQSCCSAEAFLFQFYSQPNIFLNQNYINNLISFAHTPEQRKFLLHVKQKDKILNWHLFIFGDI